MGQYRDRQHKNKSRRRYPSILIASDPVLIECEVGGLRDHAGLASKAIDNEPPFDEILWSTYTFSGYTQPGGLVILPR